MWTEKEIAWMAGLFEGEGCVTLTSHYRSKKPYARVSLGMTDADVIEKFYKICGMGTISYNKLRPNRIKPMIYWRIGKREEIIVFLNAILPEMGKRRSLKIIETLEIIEERARPIKCLGCGALCSYSQNRKYCTRNCGRRYLCRVQE